MRIHPELDAVVIEFETAGDHFRVSLAPTAAIDLAMRIADAADRLQCGDVS